MKTLAKTQYNSVAYWSYKYVITFKK